jgi:hypothetical protein
VADCLQKIQADIARLPDEPEETHLYLVNWVRAGRPPLPQFAQLLATVLSGVLAPATPAALTNMARIWRWDERAQHSSLALMEESVQILVEREVGKMREDLPGYVLDLIRREIAKFMLLSRQSDLPVVRLPDWMKAYRDLLELCPPKSRTIDVVAYPAEWAPEKRKLLDEALDSVPG